MPARLHDIMQPSLTRVLNRTGGHCLPKYPPPPTEYETRSRQPMPARPSAKETPKPIPGIRILSRSLRILIDNLHVCIGTFQVYIHAGRSLRVVIDILKVCIGTLYIFIKHAVGN